MSKFGGGGTKCNICDKTAYPAETVMFEKVAYHANCFRCVECNKKITPGGAATYDGKIYCTHDFEKNGFAQKQRQVKWTKKESTGSGGASKFGGGGAKCEICTKTVYSAETLSFEKKVYHPNCFKCTVCERKLNTSEASSFDSDIICRKCFAAGGYTQKQTASAKQGWQAKTGEGGGAASKFGGGGTKCDICAKTVYAAETISFEKRAYHAGCFKCKVCDRKITPSDGNKWEGEDGREIICGKCFGDGGYRQKQVTGS